MYGTVRTFVIEPSGSTRRDLRRFASGSQCPGGFSYHDARVPLDVVSSPDPRREITSADQDIVTRSDPRWPQACACGYLFRESDTWQVFTETLYRRAGDADSPAWGLSKVPAGALWRATWMEDDAGWRGPDGCAWVVKLPDGRDWMIDGPAVDHKTEPPTITWHAWTRHGTAPLFTVTPSILTPKYHGFLTDGELRPC